MTRQARRPRLVPFLLGLGLIGVGGATASASQTSLEAGQSASLWLLACTVAFLAFVLNRARTSPSA